MKKKLSSYIVIGLVLALALMGCSSNETSGGGKDGVTEISFIHWRGEDAEVFKELISKFEKENPKIKVDMTIYPSEEYQSTAQTILRDGSTGDIFTSFPGSQFEIIKKAGLFADISNEEFVGKFSENLIEAGKADGKQLAVPLQLVYNQPVYNKGIFEKLGLQPAKDWEGFLALCEELKKNGYIPIAFPGADIGPGQLMNTMMMNNAPDEEIFTKLMAGDAKLTDEWWVKTLSQFKELVDKGYITKEALGTKHDGAIALMAQEKAAMLASGSYAMAGIKQQNPDIKLQLLAPITVAESEAKYEGVHTTTFMLAVNSKSEKQEAAKKFISFLTEKENAEDYANKTGQHVTLNDVAYESEELKETAVWMEKNTRFQPRFLIPNADVEKAVIASIQAVIGGTEPEKAAAEAQKIVDQNLSK
ncbi:ABC transporter substrate-binding protein [Peribacillus frigoritolerans]|uniref:ABC transporter substrate-binding protein n=1 Tax=Peribacillus frigoritolerans TaxID=450367 RepID=UPI00105A94C7|nr:extracellular solute-binding protein [Peribacillus frigoritolerans]TDL80585.1 extracellular solute-binding protein [Peribacillus frigoritolerans]